MQDKMVKLLNQIGMNTDYLENASINKIVVYDNNKLWNFVINNDRILPVYIYNELINKIKVTFSSIDNIKLSIFIDNDCDEYINDYISYKVKLPLIGEVKLKNLTLPLVTVVIGLADGFNPCAMWVLLFLISMLIGMKDKKRMWILGSTFLLTSALIYLIFMMSWLNLANLLISVVWVRVIIAIVSLVGGIINLRGYIKHRKVSGCDVVDDKKRNKIITRIKKFTTEKNFWLAILGVIVLAISVNVVELACSAGLPVMFIEILSLNNLTAIEEIIYIVLYMLFFLLDDFVVFVIAMTTLSLTGVSSKYGNLSKLIGGILMLLIGLLLMFKPEWIMFNF